MNFWQINGETRLKMLGRLVQNKLVSRRAHPDQPLYIYNYTHKAMEIPPVDWALYPGLNQARGLILDGFGRVVMRSFEKAWDLVTTREIGELDPNQVVSIHEKFDGYLIVARYWQGNLIVSSRGSFESEHAAKAKELLLAAPWLHHLQIDDHYTFVFELLWHDRPVVVEQAEDELVLLGAFENVREASAGPDGDMEEMLSWWSGGGHGLRDVPRFAGPLREVHLESLDEALVELVEDEFWADSEGFVLKFSDGYSAKVKLDWYKNAAALMRFSTKQIWQKASEGDADFFNRVSTETPLPFSKWVGDTVAGWVSTATERVGQAQEAFASFKAGKGTPKDRRALAKFVKDMKKPILAPLVFAIADGKSSEEVMQKAFKGTKPRRAEFYAPAFDDGSEN